MKYVYAALLLHASGKKIDEESIKNIITATGEAPDEARVKTLIASLSEVDIEAAIKVAPGIALQAPEEVKSPVKEKKDVEKAEEKEEKTDDEAIAGLGALFG